MYENTNESTDQGAVDADVLKVRAYLLLELRHKGVRVPFFNGLADHSLKMFTVLVEDLGDSLK